MKQIVMFLLLVLYSGIAFAGFFDGNKLLEDCESSNAIESVACIVYIAGVSDASQEKTWDGLSYCTPDNAAIKQYMKIVTKYLNEYPERLHYSAYTLVQSALLEAFPCE